MIYNIINNHCYINNEIIETMRMNYMKHSKSYISSIKIFAVSIEIFGTAQKLSYLHLQTSQ